MHTPGQAQAHLSELVANFPTGFYGGEIARFVVDYDDGSSSIVSAEVANEIARLIAAAPDLLEALEAIAHKPLTDNPEASLETCLAEIVRIAEAAIAKAKP